MNISVKNSFKYLMLICMLGSMNWVLATDYPVSTYAEFQALASSLQAGDTVTFANGTYADVGEVTIENLKGSPLNPIVLRSESLYGARFTGNSWLTFRNCDYLRIEGFKFEEITSDRALNPQSCNHTTVSRCSFINSGPKDATGLGARIMMCRFDLGLSNIPTRNAYNILEYCYFSHIYAGGAFIFVMSDSKDNVGQNIARYNVFRDAPSLLSNGGEAIGVNNSGKQKNNPGNTTIEGNVFDNWNGDGEIISVKSGSNIFRHNVFTNYTAGSLSLRREKNNLVESNFFINGQYGVWGWGADHIIKNNVFLDMGEGIRLTSGGNLNPGDPAPVFETSKNNIVSNNTFLGTRGFFIKLLYQSPWTQERTEGNQFINNVFSSDTGIEFFRFYREDGSRPTASQMPTSVEATMNTFSNNLYWSDGPTAMGIPLGLGTNNVVADPQAGSDLFRVFEGTSPVIGAGVSLAEVEKDFFGNTRVGNDIGHVAYPVDVSGYESPFMFFPPDTTGLAAMPSAAEFDFYPFNIQDGDVVMMDARASKGSYSKLNWIINGVASGAIDEDIFSFVFDASESYIIELQLIDGAGNVVATKSETLGFNVIPDTEAPSVPSGLAASDVLFTSFDIAWGYSTDDIGVAGYNIYLNGNLETTITDLNLEELSYSFSGLTNDTEYTVIVEAVDASGNASQASIVLTTPTPDVVAPSVPTNLSIVDVYSTSANLSWAVSTDPEGYQSGVAGYEVFVDGVSVGTSETNSFFVEGLIASSSFAITVKAFDLSGNISAASQGVNLATTVADTQAPTVPSSVASLNVGYLALSVTWDASTDNEYVVGYNVYLDGVLQGTVETTEFSFAGLLPSSSYTVDLEAFDITGNTSAKVSYAATTLQRSSRINAANIEEFLYFLPILQGGDTLSLAPGVYADLGKVEIINLPATAASPIVIMSEEVYGAVFTGDTEFSFTGCDYLTLQGFSFNGLIGRTRIIALASSNHSAIQQCSFINSGSTSARIEAVRISGSGVSFNTVQNCVFENLAGGAITLVLPSNPAGGNRILNNVFRNALSGARAAVSLFGGGNAGNTLVEGNVFDVWSKTFVMNVRNGGNI